MEIKIKHIISFLLFLTGQMVFCQTKDTIPIKLNLTEYINFAKENIQERYNFTLKNRELLKTYLDQDTSFLLTNYKLEDLKIISIPNFKLSKNTQICKKNNIINYINFNINPENQSYNIYLNDEIVCDEIPMYKSDDKSDIMFYSLIGNDFKNPIRIGGANRGYLMKLGLEKKYPTFMIDGIPPDTYFIIDSGIIYAITNPDNTGNYKKTEINEYFATFLGEDGLKKVLNNEFSTVFHQKMKRLKNETKHDPKFYNNLYYIALILK